MATAPSAKRVRFAAPDDEKIISPVAVIVENGELPEDEVLAAFARTRPLHRRIVGNIKYADLPVHDVAATINALCAAKGMHGRFESLLIVRADYGEARGMGLEGLARACAHPITLCAADPVAFCPALANAVFSQVVVLRTNLFSTTDDTDARYHHDMDLLAMRIIGAAKECDSAFFNRVQLQGAVRDRKRDARMRWSAMPVRNTPDEHEVVARQLRRDVLGDTFLIDRTAVAVGHEFYHAYLGQMPVGAAEVTYDVFARLRALFPTLSAPTPSRTLGMVDAVLTHEHTGELLMVTSHDDHMNLYWVPPTWMRPEEGDGVPGFRMPPLAFKNACLQLLLLLRDDTVFE